MSNLQSTVATTFARGPRKMGRNVNTPAITRPTMNLI
jgi:hypothetical protein